MRQTYRILGDIAFFGAFFVIAPLVGWHYWAAVVAITGAAIFNYLEGVCASS